VNYAENKRILYDYEVVDTYTAGMMLSGKQASYIRQSKVVIPASYVVWQKKRLELINISIDGDTVTLPLLLEPKEIKEIRKAMDTKGFTVVAVRIKPVRRWIKVDIAVAKGKKEFEKRDTIKKRDLDRLEKKGLL
jgi:SsrA-binding protein